MSADNGIYIAKFPDGFRVAYGHAIENVTYYPIGSIERKEELREYFGESPLFDTRDSSDEYAMKLSKEHDFLEYGIAYIGEFEMFENTNEKEKISKRIEELTESIRKSQNELDKLVMQNNFEINSKAVGKCYKLVNGISDPESGNSWCIYRKNTRVDEEGEIRIWEFENRPDGMIVIHKDYYDYDMENWIEITPIEFYNVWDRLVGEIVDFEG